MDNWLSSWLFEAMRSLLRPLYEFLNAGGARYFWLYCATGVLIAMWVHQRRNPSQSFSEVFWDRETWLGRSAINDYVILLTGFFIRVTLLWWAYFSWEPVAAWVTSVLRSIGVTGTVTDGTSVSLALLLTLALFLVDDFLRYVVHLAMHRVPELWEYHKVHHSAEKLNFATSERFHPIETCLTSAGLFLGVGVVNGIFFAFFGDKLTPITVFGANIFLFAFNLAGGVLRHAPVWVSFPYEIERWVISPAMHQIHHSENPKHYDSNMGGSLSIWDRMFGTIYYGKDAEPEMTGFGIGEETKEYRTLKGLFIRPIVQCVQLFVRRFKPAAAPMASKAHA